MREIKFRGRCVSTNEWFYGDFYQYHQHDSIYIMRKYVDGHVGLEKVDPETVGQYTGLKDKNGREIYEGDIVEYDGGKTLSRSKMLVEWIDGGYVLSAYREDWAYYLGDCLTKSLEIIGNSYENPEL